jgi:hypothetical protein
MQGCNLSAILTADWPGIRDDLLSVRRINESGLSVGNAKNPPTQKEPMQPIQTTLGLGFETEAQLASTLEVLAIYSFRVSQRGPQPELGRHGTQEWLEALEVMAQAWGRERALEEVKTVVELMREFYGELTGNEADGTGKAEMLEVKGMRAVRGALALPDNNPMSVNEGRIE